MSTTLAVCLSLLLAGALAWTVRRFELSRYPRPSRCEPVLNKVFGAGSGETSDATLLARLLEHQDDCLDDAAYVEQLRRLFVNTQQIARARTLLDEAASRQVFKPDMLAAQRAWVDLAEAHEAWTNDSLTRAHELLTRSMTSANALRTKWPEWSVPYLILGEASHESWAADPSSPPVDYDQVERRVRRGVWNGAFVRALSDWQPMVFAFVVAFIGLFGLSAAVSGYWAEREMLQLVTSPIADAKAGYVELKGTLHLARGTDAVIGPHSHTPGVWYELEQRSGFKGSRTTYQRTAQPFVIRDATGDAVVEPRQITVHTCHVDATFASPGGLSASGHVTERMLRENDTVYVLGQLRDVTSPDGARVRTIGVAENGRRLLVSNLSEDQLVLFERVWLRVGAGVALLSVLLLVWSYYQRYLVQAIPA